MGLQASLILKLALNPQIREEPLFGTMSFANSEASCKSLIISIAHSKDHAHVDLFHRRFASNQARRRRDTMSIRRKNGDARNRLNQQRLRPPYLSKAQNNGIRREINHVFLQEKKISNHRSLFVPSKTKKKMGSTFNVTHNSGPNVNV